MQAAFVFRLPTHTRPHAPRCATIGRIHGGVHTGTGVEQRTRYQQN